jgi:hypothetical protein
MAKKINENSKIGTGRVARLIMLHTLIQHTTQNIFTSQY